MPIIKPISDLRNNFNQISEICHKEMEPVFITKNGYGDLVVLSIEAYEELIDTLQADAAIRESEQELENGGELVDAREALSSLRRKYSL